ncbi:GntP family permease [Geomicrobium sp. JSM 1781026]|uniref:GntP family permease n=1 Tax=Geomicrobium sp. JSM 1781026 TaxID=3344580 RepID=UPI0035C1FE32
MNLEVFAIFLALGLLIFLALRGFSIIVIAPVASVVVIVLTGMPLLESLQETYMSGFINFTKNFFFIFLFAAMFGKVMEDSGAAAVMARGILRIIGKNSKMRVLLAIVAISAALTYGGIAVHVVIFAMLPIAKPLFKELDIPWHLFIAAFFFGAATFTMTMLPGAPSVPNIIPTEYLGTTVMAAPLIGIVVAIATIFLNSVYLRYALRKSEKRGETYRNMKNLERVEDDQKATIKSKEPHFIVAILPPIVLLVLLNIFQVEIIFALVISVVSGIVMFWKFLDQKIKTINTGATNTVLPIVNTSADVGFGAVIAASAGFAIITEWLTTMPGSPLISLYLATTILAGITGSASGGLAIAMEALSETFMQLGLDPDIVHRVATIAAGGFDALPHNGGVITFLVVAGLTHKDAYKHIFATGIVGPVLATIPALALAILLY